MFVGVLICGASRSFDDTNQLLSLRACVRPSVRRDNSLAVPGLRVFTTALVAAAHGAAVTLHACPNGWTDFHRQAGVGKLEEGRKTRANLLPLGINSSLPAFSSLSCKRQQR